MSKSKKEITIYPQTFTSGQQNIARNNISAVSLANVKSDIRVDSMNVIKVPNSNVYVCLAKFAKAGGHINGNIWLNFSSTYSGGSIGFYTINVKNNSGGTTLYNKSITGQQNRPLPINLYFNESDNYYYIIADTTGKFNPNDGESHEIMWQWLGYNAGKAILANTTNLETFSDISSLTPVSWSVAGGIQIVNSDYLNVISKVTAESKFYNNSYDLGTIGTILFEMDSNADEAYIHGVVNIVLNNINGPSRLGLQSLLKVDFVKKPQGVDCCVIGLSEDYETVNNRSKLYHVRKLSENKDYLIIVWGQGDPLNVKAQWNSLTCKNVTILNTALTRAWLSKPGTTEIDINGYTIVNNEIEYALSAGYATSATNATNATYANTCSIADFAHTANYSTNSLSASNAHTVDSYHVAVGSTGTATNTIYFY